MTKKSSDEIRAYLEMKEAFAKYGEPLMINGVPYKKYAAEMERAVKAVQKNGN